MDIKMTDQEWTPPNPLSANPPPSSSSPLRLPATPPSATHLGHSSSSSTSATYSRTPQYATHPPLSPVHQRPLPPPLPIQPYTTPPNRQNPTLPPIHTPLHPHPSHPQYHPPPPNAPPTPGETPWDLRQIDVYRLDEHTLRLKLIDAIHHIQHLSSHLSQTKTLLAQYALKNEVLQNESREISQRSAVETELAKREVEVLLREYAAQMPSANQLANTYYRRYRGTKLRVKDLEAVIEDKNVEIKRLQEYVRDNGITVPRETNKRTRRTGLKYAPRGGAWGSKPKSPSMQRTLKPAPIVTTTIKSEANSQESQQSGLDALGMLASQVLDSQESPQSQQQQQQQQQQQSYLPPSTPQNRPPSSSSLSVVALTSTPSRQNLRVPSSTQKTLLSPLPLPTPSTKRRRDSRASDSTVDHDDPALTESEKSPTKYRVIDDTDDERIRESPPAQQIPYSNVNVVPIPYRTNLNGRDQGPRRKLNFDSQESDILNHDV